MSITDKGVAIVVLLSIFTAIIILYFKDINPQAIRTQTTIAVNPLGPTPPGPSFSVPFENSKIKLVFANLNGVFTLVFAEDKQTGRIFQAVSTDLWTITIRDNSGVKTVILPSNTISTFSSQLINLGTKQKLIFNWNNIIFNSQNLGSVRVAIELENDIPTADFLINISLNPLNQYSVYRVDFPRIQMEKLSNVNDEALVTSFVYGRLIINPRSFIPIYGELPYQSQLAIMQLLVYYDIITEDLVYFASKDPDGYTKSYGLNITSQNLGFSTIHFPEDNLVTKVYNAPFASAFGVFRGDWYDAASYYRKWAINQPFVSRGKLEFASPSQLSPIFHNTNFHTTLVSYSREFNKGIKEINDWKQYLSLCPDPNMVAYICNPSYILDKTLVELYHWNSNAATGIGYPLEYGGITEGLMSFVNNSHTEGDIVIPYFLPEIFDVNVSSFNQTVADNVLVNENGNIVLEPNVFAPGYFYAFLDPSTSWTQNLYRDIMLNLSDFGDDNTLFAGVGFDGWFWDVWSATEGMLDYGNHGHPKGGGNYWLNGKNAIAIYIRNTLNTINPNWVMESEMPTEYHINTLEFVQLDNIRLDVHPFYNVLLYPAVYHDYVGISSIVSTSPVLATGVNNDPNGITFSNYIMALYFTYGVMPSVSNGLLDTNLTFPIQQPLLTQRFFNFVKKLFRSYLYAKPYLLYGQRIKDLELQVSNIHPSQIWLANVDPMGITQTTNIYFKDHYPNVPKVIPTVWNASDGSIGIVLINWWTNDEPATFTFKFSDYGLTPGQAYNLELLEETQITLINTYTNDFTHTLTVPKEHIIVLKLS